MAPHASPTTRTLPEVLYAGFEGGFRVYDATTTSRDSCADAEDGDDESGEESGGEEDSA